jgi:hypothetical protein
VNPGALAITVMVIGWELCRHFADSAFLLATVLDPSEPRDANAAWPCSNAQPPF